MESLKICSNCGNTKMVLRLEPDGDIGWMCEEEECMTFWGLSSDEEKIYRFASKRGAEMNEPAIKNYRKLIKVLQEALGLDRNSW